MFKKESTKRSIAVISWIILVISLFLTPVLAWRMDKSSANLTVNSSIIGSYFEQGNGTADTPYVIARPIQLYYFGWLQNLGYFDGQNPNSTTSDKKFYFTLGADIDMSESLEYSILPPIGTPDHPFVGVFDGRYHYAPANNGTDPFDPDNTIEGTYHVISNATISNTGLSYIPQGGDDGMKYMGLFGVVGSMTNVSATGEIKNFALDNVTVETADPDDDETIVGIVAGYCNGVCSGIGVSNCSISVVSGVGPAELAVHNTNPDTGITTTTTETPETLSFSLIGFSDTTYQAYTISPVSGGNEFGGSLAMREIYDRIIAARDSNDGTYTYYYDNKTILIDEDGNVSESVSGEHIYQASTSNAYYRFRNLEVTDEDDNVIESYGLVLRSSNSGFTSITNNYMYLAGGWSSTRTQVITTITRTRYDAFTIGDGNGNYLVGTSSGTSNTTNSGNATAWRFSNGANGGTFTIQDSNETTYYLYNNNGTLQMSSSNSTNWTISNGQITNGGYYLVYLDGAWRLWTETTYFYINNGNGTYLNMSGTTITSGNTATTRWHVASNKIYYYNGNTKTYLYNNNGTLTTTTNVNTANAWTIDAVNNTISNNGYYLLYLDGAWQLLAETTYYYINNGNGTYLNISNGNIVSGNTATTRWHIAGNKLYYYNGTTKTYLYNNNGVLTTTTNSGTANTWTVDSVNNTIKNGDFYLLLVDGEWIVVKEDGYYLINDGNSHYLNLTAGNIDTGTSSNTATRWYAANNKIYTYVNGTANYLYNNNGALTITTNSGTASTWTVANNNIKNGNYYLVYNNGWKLTEEIDYYLISDGSGHYLNLTSNGIEIGTSSNASEWHITNDNKVYTYVNGTANYLVNNNGSLTYTTTLGSATGWTVGANSITNGGYYLVYQNGWKLTNETNYYLISDGNGHYLNLTSSGYEVGTSSNAMGWHFTNGQSGGKIYTYVNGVKTYIYNNSGVLSTTTTEGNATTWTVSNGQIKSTISTTDYYLTYRNEWKLTSDLNYYTIHDGSGNYLNLTGSGYSVGTSDTATDWQFESTTSGKIYTYINGVATYLYRNGGTLSTTTNSGSATTWTILNDTTNNCYNISNGGYFLRYDTTWGVTNDVSYYYIHDNNNHYLNLNSSTHLTEIGTSSNATAWKFSNKSSGGKISANVGGTDYYLNYNSSNMVPQNTTEANATSWTISGSTIYCTNNNTNYYMFCDGECWTIVRNGLNSYYLISDGNEHYLSCNATQNSNVTVENVRSYARKWEFDSRMSNNSAYTIPTNINGTNYYLYRNSSNALQVRASGTSWRYDSGNRYIYYRSGNTRRYIRYYNNGWSSLGSSATAIGSIESVTSSTRTAISVVSDRQPDLVARYATGTYNRTNTISSSQYDLEVSIAHNNYNLTANAPYTAYNTTAIASSNSYNLVAKGANNNYDIEDVISPTTTVWQNTVVNNNGQQTMTTNVDYIPLSMANDGTVSLRNTGYIVSGTNYNYGSSYPGDIRVSYYAVSSNLNNALGGSVSYSSSRLEVVTRTYLSNGFVRISDTYNASNSNTSSTLTNAFPTKSSTTTTPLALGLDRYTNARDQLHTTLNGQSNVYGLHFMDAQITPSRTVTIGKATINNEHYTNYVMPQDCIDFNLNTRGALTFFAGTYFPGNTAFFSLHKIERTDGAITSIREISKIYGDPNNNGATYLYEYVGGSTPTLPSGYVLMFDTSWITAPTMVENAMYYFEIPVNAGEYALGSVSGADGAYLIYLDIGATGKALADGTTLETAIKGIDFVTSTSITSANIATTLAAITSSTNSHAVIVLKNRFQGTVNYVRTDNGNQVTITYTLSDSNSADYVGWTKESNDTSVIANTS